MRSNLEERLHFMNYACFGIDDKDDNLFPALYEDGRPPESLIVCAAKKAYKNVQSKIPYDNYGAEDAYFNQMKRDFRNDVIEHLAAMIPHFINNEIDVSDLIISTSHIGNNYPEFLRGDCRFTIGLAQNWVNTTLKYLWIIGAIDGDRLHVPIDRKIIEAATSYGNECFLGISYDYQNNNLNNWPSWDDVGEYINFQDRIRSEVDNRGFGSPIKWENKAWITIATR